MVESAFHACDEPMITPQHLPKRIEHAQNAMKVPKQEVESIQLDDFLGEIEKELIERALKQTKSNKAKASELLGISRARLLRRMEQLKITEM